MKRIGMWAIAVVVLVVMTLGFARAYALERRGWRGHGWHHPGVVSYLTHELKLSDAQREKIQAIWRMERPTIAARIQEFLAESKEMNAISVEENPDMGKVQAIANRESAAIAALLVEKEQLQSIHRSFHQPCPGVRRRFWGLFSATRVAGSHRAAEVHIDRRFNRRRLIVDHIRLETPGTHGIDGRHTKYVRAAHNAQILNVSSFGDGGRQHYDAGDLSCLSHRRINRLRLPNQQAQGIAGRDADYLLRCNLHWGSIGAAEDSSNRIAIV
jgi:Spy/CpxP family protein refolding chaperone